MILINYPAILNRHEVHNFNKRNLINQLQLSKVELGAELNSVRDSIASRSNKSNCAVLNMRLLTGLSIFNKSLECISLLVRISVYGSYPSPI